jgi:hypothetical protein
MLTIFSTPKPFRGHINVIQRNAIKSWTLLHPGVEVILFGDEEGAAEVCKEFVIRHEPKVHRHKKGPKYLDYIFDRAQEIARYDVICYVNCDIILMFDFGRAVKRVSRRWSQFLMVGRRWDTNVTSPLDLTDCNWEKSLQHLARRQGRLRSATWIDYFVFSRGLYHHKVPPFVIGRTWWDPWMVWSAMSSRAAVVDASRVVMAIHQNHDYSHHPQGYKGVSQDDLARRNQQLFGAWTHWQTTDSANYVLTAQGLRRRYYRRWLVPVRLHLRYYASMFWFGILDFTRPVRKRLGIRNVRSAKDTCDSATVISASRQ